MLPSVKCIKCKKAKTLREFYRTSTGYRSTTCNKCKSDIAKERNREIAKRKKKAKMW